MGSPWQWPRTLLPVIQGTRHTDFEHKLGEEKWDRGPFVNIHLIKILFFFHAIFWLFPVILFLKGECNVPPKISVTLKKKRKKKPTKQTNQQKKKPLWGPWRKFYPFKCISKLAILLYFVIFHRREKWSLHDHIKEVWSNRKTGASARTQPGCPVARCSPSGSTWQLLPIALGGSDEVCVCQVPATGSSQCVETILSMHRQRGTGSSKNIAIQENYYFHTWNVMSGFPFVRHAKLYALLCFYWV